MARHRHDLPQLGSSVVLTDSGLETDLIFNYGYELPLFAAFVLLDDQNGVAVLDRYYRAHAAIAAEASTGFLLEAPTWRASADWGERLGYTAEALDQLNRRAIDLLVDLRATLDEQVSPVIVSGCVGPRGDGYQPAELMAEDEARRYHSAQIATFADTEADVVTAMTITYPAEAIGIARAAVDAGIPVAISFTVETDGRLPDGTPLGEAVTTVDDATAAAPAYFMVNCAHPSHFEHVLEPGSGWTERIRALRANASRSSHAELDEAEELDDGDPHEFGIDYRRLRERLPGLTVLGGCCGTDHRHVREIAAACVAGAS
jgi:homocysteine S-methyltransferase